MLGRGVSANPGVRFVGVYDPRRVRAQSISKQFGGKAYPSLEELLADDRVEAVHVLTPAEHHVEPALASLKAGKHVLVEKPVAWRAAAIRKLSEAASQYGRVCMPAHNCIYMSALRRAKRLIEDVGLGAIASSWILYNVFHPVELSIRHGGVIRAVGVHLAYSLLYLLGRPRQMMAVVSRVRHGKLTCDRQAMIVCEMPNGATANLWSSFAAKDLRHDPWTVVYKILGTRGSGSYTWNEAQVEDDRGPAWGFPCYEESFANEIHYFVNQCIRAGRPPLSTLGDAADALRILQAAERSVRRGTIETINCD